MWYYYILISLFSLVLGALVGAKLMNDSIMKKLAEDSKKTHPAPPVSYPKASQEDSEIADEEHFLSQFVKKLPRTIVVDSRERAWAVIGELRSSACTYEMMELGDVLDMSIFPTDNLNELQNELKALGYRYDILYDFGWFKDRLMDARMEQNPDESWTIIFPEPELLCYKGRFIE